MSFSKAQDLVRLAHMAASRRHGVSLDDIRAEFDVSHRTAQRMTEALETVFTNVETEDGEDRRRRWRVADPMLGRLQPRQETAIEALQIASRTAHGDGRLRHAAALDDLRDGLLARLTPRDALRAEADVEAVLMAMGSVTRPGPRVNLAPQVSERCVHPRPAGVPPPGSRSYTGTGDWSYGAPRNLSEAGVSQSHRRRLSAGPAVLRPPSSPF